MELKRLGNIYKSGGQAGEIYHATGLSPTIAFGKRGGIANMPLVYIPTNSTSTPPKHITRTLEDKLTQETLLPSQPQTSPTMTFLSEAFLAKLSPLLENEKDLTTPEVHSSLISLGFSQTKDPDIWYSKTSKVYLVTTVEKLSRQSLGFSPTLGMSINGRFLIQKTSEYPRTGNASSLSDILEDNPDPKYFLSEEMSQKILSQTKDGKQTFSRPSGRPITRAVITQPVILNRGRLEERSNVNAIDANYHKGPDDHGQRTLVHNIYGGFGEKKPREFTDISPTIRTPGGGGHPPMVMRQPLRFLDRNQKNIEGDYAFTIDSSNTGGVKVEGEIRRLTPIECERLQGFPDNWTALGLSSIMGMCANINPAIGSLLQKSDIAYSITSDGKDMEVRICPSESRQPVFAVDGLVLESSVIDTIKAGNATVTRYSQSEMSNTAEPTRLKDISERVAEKSTSRLWSVILDASLSGEKLSTTLTSIHAIMKSPIFTSAKTAENITGYIIHLNLPLPNYTSEDRLSFRTGNITPTSDTQRYKQMGNAVTVNVVEAVMRRLYD